MASRNSSLNLLSLNLDVLSDILSFLPSKDACRLAATSRRVYALAIRRALSEVVLEDSASATLFCRCMLLDVSGRRSLFLRDLEVQFELDVGWHDGKLPHLLHELLMQARNLKCLCLRDSERWLELEPPIGQAITALPIIIELTLMDAGPRTLRLLPQLCCKPLHLSYDCYLDNPVAQSLLFTSPALQKVEFLSISGLETMPENEATDSRQQYEALRTLQLSHIGMPMSSFVYAFPNVRTLSLRYISRPTDWGSDIIACWPCLDHVRGVVGDFQVWRVACPVHHLDLESKLITGLPLNRAGVLRETQRAGILRAVEDMSPVVLTLKLDVQLGPELWRPLVNVMPRLACLALRLRGEGGPPGVAFLAWTEAVIPIMASLKITCLKIYIICAESRFVEFPPEDGFTLGSPDPFDSFRAVCQTLPTLLARSIASLKYLSVAIQENTMGNLGTRGTNAWWRLAKTEKSWVMERFPTSEGENLLERICSEPGAEQKLIV